MPEHDDQDREFIERASETLRAPEALAPDFMSRLMASVRAESRTGARSLGEPAHAVPWWRRRRTIRLSLSPVGALALAAGLAAIALIGSAARRALVAPAPAPVAATVAARTDTVHVVRFVFMAPGASSVALVGDFNNWERGATRLRRVDPNGTWVTTIPIRAGLHQYAFIVDGKRWTPDPAAATTVTDDFGTTTSIIAIGS